MTEQIIEYPTHTLFIKEVENPRFVKVTNLVKDTLYQEMVEVCITNLYADFVFEERKLLNNFLKSLVSFNNRKENLFNGASLMFIFEDDAEYYIFCVINDLKYEEQEWFKTIYIGDIFLNSISLLIRTSVALLKTLYPDLYRKPTDLRDEFYRDIKDNNRSYLYSDEVIKEFLVKNKIFKLYHFSSRDNLNSIKTHGIFSILEMKRLGIKTKFSSSNISRAIDSNKQLSHYVHLSYERDNPMLYMALAEGRIYDYVIFEISPEVIFYKGTLFSNMNAANNEAVLSSDINFFLNLPFGSFHNKKYSSLSEDSKKNYQAEILIKSIIPKNQIININEL